MVRALRGETAVDLELGALSDVAGAATGALLRTLLECNALTVDDVISALFTVTPDLYEAAPARAACEGGWHDVPMLTAAEAQSAHGLAHCVRVMLHVHTSQPRGALRHVYLHGARLLRTDLVEEGGGGH